MTKVFVAQHPTEAHLVAGLLTCRGIEAEVQGEALFSARGEVPVTPATLPSVWVLDDRQADEALEILRDRPGDAPAAMLEKAFGYQDDHMNLPVRDLASAVPFYENVLGFAVVSRRDAPHKSAVLARDQVQIGLAENGGDSSQDGCAFHVMGLEALFAEFQANGLGKERSDFDVEQLDGVAWRVFYVVAPDGLCYWFGERQA